MNLNYNNVTISNIGQDIIFQYLNVLTCVAAAEAETHPGVY